MKDAKGQQAAKRRRDGLRGVEDGEPTSQLATTVERGLIIDDEREKGRLTHAQEPADRHQASEIPYRNHHQRHEAETAHHHRQHPRRSVFLAQDPQDRGGEDVGHEEDGQDDVVLVSPEVEGFLQAGGFGVAEVGFVERVEEVHYC